MWLVGVVVPILLFFVSMNATYSYFTASAKKQTATGSTAIIRIEMSNDQVQVNSVEYDSQLLVPGDTLTFTGKLNNTGSSPVYTIMVLKTEIKRTDGQEDTPLIKYYTYASNEWSEMTINNGAFSLDSFELKNSTSLDFSLDQTLAGEKYGEEYFGASVVFTVSAFSIQTANLTLAQANAQLYSKVTA